MKILEPAGLILILVLVVILFGPRRLPDIARPFRRKMTVFRDDPSASTDEDAGGSSEDHAGESGTPPTDDPDASDDREVAGGGRANSNR